MARIIVAAIAVPRPRSPRRDHMPTTLRLAAALFVSGLTTSLRVRLARVLLLAGASLTIADAASRLIDLPIA